MIRGILRGALFIGSVSAFAAVPPETGGLRAGAAKVDITPAADAALPMSGYAGRL